MHSSKWVLTLGIGCLSQPWTSRLKNWFQRDPLGGAWRSLSPSPPGGPIWAPQTGPPETSFPPACPRVVSDLSYCNSQARAKLDNRHGYRAFLVMFETLLYLCVVYALFNSLLTPSNRDPRFKRVLVNQIRITANIFNASHSSESLFIQATTTTLPKMSVFGHSQEALPQYSLTIL